MHDRVVEVPLLVHEFLGVVHLVGISRCGFVELLIGVEWHIGRVHLLLVEKHGGVILLCGHLVV